MIALDTNVLLRYIVRDDARQAAAWQALNCYEVGHADYADYVIGLCGRDEKAEGTWTFDRRTVGSPLFKQLPA